MRIITLAMFAVIFILPIFAIGQMDSGQSTQQQQFPVHEPIQGDSGWFKWNPITLALMGAGIAALFAGIGSAVGCTIAGGMAAGGLQENPRLFGQFLPLAAAPGTQGVYGFVITVLILNKIGAGLSIDNGWQLFFAGMPVGFAGLISAIYQGKVCASSIGLVVKDPKALGKSLVFPALVEFYAILGLLCSVLMLNKI